MKNGKTQTHVVARMTITFHNSKRRVFVEVHQDASFQKFYTWYSQLGRENKHQILTTHRGYGIAKHWRQPFETPGLELVGEYYAKMRKDVKDIKIKIFRKREYNRLLNCAPDELTGGLPKAADTERLISQARNARRGLPIRIPIEYLTLQKRMDIITGAES